MDKKPKTQDTRRRENILRIRLNERERKMLNDYARQEKLDTSTWARMELLKIAENRHTQR